MAFVTIAGNDYEVTHDGAQELEPVTVGARFRTANGKQRSTIRAVIRGWGMTLLFRGDLSDEETLRDDVGMGEQVACGGDALKGATPTCEVEIGASGFIPADGATYGHWRTLAITLREAAPA